MHSPLGGYVIEVAKRLALDHQVLYVNPPLNLKTFWREKRNPSEERRPLMAVQQGKAEPLKQESQNLWVLHPKVLLRSINWLPDGSVYDYFNKSNNNSFGRSIQETLQKLRWREIILINDGLMLDGFYIKEILKPKLSLYLSRTNLVDQGYFSRHGKRLEAQLMAQSEAVLTSTLGLAKRAQRHNPRVRCIGAGFDAGEIVLEEDYAPVPSDWPTDKPVIGFMGALLTKRLDLTFMEEVVATAPPDWQWVFIGPLDQEFRTSSLAEKKNCHFIGPRPPDALASYLQQFSAAWHPLRADPILEMNHPAKTYHYFTAGCPVVLPKTVTNAVFGDLAYLCQGVQETIVAFERALEEEDEKKSNRRKELARAENWGQSVAQLHNFLEELMPMQKRGSE